MDKLTYSDDAINVRSQFYDCDKIVYVEGEDDVVFWQIIFSAFLDKKVAVQECGGVASLADLCKKIVSGSCSDIVARDRDYHFKVPSDLSHSNILFTFGHSIENSLIDSLAVSKLISLSCKSNHCVQKHYQDWLEASMATLIPLIVHDYYKEVNSLGIVVMGDTCDRFLVSKNGIHFAEDKIELFIQTLGLEFDFKSIYGELMASTFSWIDMVKGHFLVSAVRKFVVKYTKDNAKKINLPYDNFYTFLFLHFENSIKSTHSHHSYYQEIIDDLDI